MRYYFELKSHNLIRMTAVSFNIRSLDFIETKSQQIWKDKITGSQQVVTNGFEQGERILIENFRNHDLDKILS